MNEQTNNPVTTETTVDASTVTTTTTELSPKGFVPTVLLCFFLGGLGVHRFYVGKIGTGILMLLTLGGLGIWALIDFIIIVCGNFRDKNGLPIKST